MSLSECIEHRSFVPTNMPSFGIDDFPFFGINKVLKEFSHINISQKADALTVFFPSCRQIEFPCERPHFFFCVPANRKKSVPQLLLRESPQEIRLVFHRVL